MSKNRFEQVVERQEDAITLFLAKGGDGVRGYVTCPAAISHGVLTEDKLTPDMTGQEAFRAAIALANEIKAAIVVVDPEGVWLPEWGTLYQDDEAI